MAHELSIETVYQDKSLGDKQPLWRNFFVGRQITNRFGFIDMKQREGDRRRDPDRPRSASAASASRSIRPSQFLSGGERQGIAIGRAMHFNADLIVLDEPTAALGVEEVRKVLEFVRRIKQSGPRLRSISSTISPMCMRSPIAWSCSTAARSSPRSCRKDMTVPNSPNISSTCSTRRKGEVGMARGQARRSLPRFEGLPIIVVFVAAASALFMYHGAGGFPARPTSTRPSCPPLPPLVLLAIGLTFVIGAGEIDLCFPSIIGFSGFVFAILFKEYDLGWIAVARALWPPGFWSASSTASWSPRSAFRPSSRRSARSSSGPAWRPCSRAASPTRCAAPKRARASGMDRRAPFGDSDDLCLASRRFRSRRCGPRPSSSSSGSSSTATASASTFCSSAIRTTCRASSASTSIARRSSSSP